MNTTDSAGGTEATDGGLTAPPAEEAEPPVGRFRPLRKHPLLASAVAVVVLAAAVTVPLILTGSDDAKPCWRLPASTAALAKDPAAATRALDPGDYAADTDRAAKLLVPANANVCAADARILGRVVEAATLATGAGKAHTMAQARSAYAVAVALDDRHVPVGMAPGVARMLADYVVDASAYSGADKRATAAAVPPSMTRPDKNGYTPFGRFLDPREAHVDFGYSGGAPDEEADPERLVNSLAADPEAFAVLYDTYRAYLAYYLERLTSQAGDPDERPNHSKSGWNQPTDLPDFDLRHLAEDVGRLMKLRASYARDGTIPDLAAFDASVRKHTRGAFRPASGQLDTRPPMGDIADRPAAGPMDSTLMDGRHQLFTVLDGWAKERGVPARRLADIKQLMDEWYVDGLWLIAY
ncbi:hypothetical protein QR77_13300 [Streptomyces sp. 150FB]|uniref:hypothetical protein n=1 Tax=Streptomyces sp. 150FB TaxID=1576605 RepID=UPI000588F121|nr:hypothetical protein [Streptomyces sp. 150FB]KIF74681.1 hypothetical protein QR77_13300 [Streptomyces sp. 150FB]